jgi:hypothetical protein
LTLRSVWSKGQENRPWKAVDRHDLIVKSQATYVLTGTVRSIGDYLDVRIELYSDLEQKVLGEWEGRFSPEEASDRMAEVSDHFHEILLGRPWAGLSISSVLSGTKIKLGDRWHALPWSTDDLEPGIREILVQNPGLPQEKINVTLEEGRRIAVVIPAGTAIPERLVLETDPPGVSLYLDSQYLGPSPQTVDRPLSTARVRAQAPGWATLAWEVGPDTPSPSRKTLSPPQPLPSIPDAKDRFYFSLALFSISLTATSFASAWTNEQVLLTDAYAAAGNQQGYDLAYSRYQWVQAGYITGVVLTSGLFVWMMFQLNDYLNAAQANLP